MPVDGPSDPLWYKDAVIYQIHVRAFYDSNGDGIGDFPGLTQRLDYLQALGVSCLWLLPFYPSPLRDDGYDIAHYEGIHPAYGTLKDFRQFMREAHARGLKVITELVINHTSDQHPWFQAARRAPAGSVKRDYYVWSDTNRKYEGTRIIFTDSETSNWSWDPVAGAYYWHRFFRHQPDLNFDNPHVRKAVQKVMRFWFDMGVDGMRLDAVPYLIEREGTTCENLPETHEVLRELRRVMETHYHGRMLLAEANQWPADVRAYFGDGDECNMAFNFPLMPRMYMALRQEDRHPVAEIVSQTPEIPESCQWAIFLRNHDELTLEMVTDEERDYMYQAYAADPQMRINVGIRRRLAPLMENNRQRIELLNSLLFTLPGTPIIYYGDEIGMGDNIYLGDRNGVRTPMQWTPDRNAGFSRTDPARLFAPVIMDPVYGYEGLNVEAQERSPSSLLNWMKRMIALRRRHQTFGRGGIMFLEPSNRKILAYVRQYGDETILCLANLARYAQPAELDLREFAGLTPMELVGNTPFPPIGELPYFLTLGPYGFYSFLLEREPEPPVAVKPLPQPAARSEALIRAPLLVGTAWETLLDGSVRALLERDYLPAYLRTRRWFAAKARTLSRVALRDWMPIRRGPEPVFFSLVEVEYTDGGRETYSLPMAFAGGTTAERLLEESPEFVIARLSGARKGVLHERLELGPANLLLDAIAGQEVFNGRKGRVIATATSAFAELRGLEADSLHARRSSSEQSNTSWMFGDRLILKLIRRTDPGPNPELELSYHLTERAQFDRAPRLAGALEYESADGTRTTIAVMHGLVRHQATGWEQALDELERFFERVAPERDGPPPAAPVDDRSPLVGSVQVPVNPAAIERIGWYVEAVIRLGQRTAELHLALARGSEAPAFVPEPFSRDDLGRVVRATKDQLAGATLLLGERLNALPDEVGDLASHVLEAGPALTRELDTALAELPDGLVRMRIHGDYHLGQVLWGEGDFYILDFEGEPARPLAERRAKQSPLKDVAGMLRSLDYAAHAGLAAWRSRQPEDGARLAEWAGFWEAQLSDLFLRSYRAAAGQAAFLPADDQALRRLLRVYLIEKAVYELRYELNNRPGWVHIPLGGLARLIGPPGPTPAQP
ncbi:MAG TPA: maltose alpha-D-glucosyltransferase [Methylomirabilota bacterium]